MKRKLYPLLLTAAALALSASIAQAGTVTLNIIGPITLFPGGSTTVMATVAAPVQNTGAVFLNGDNASVDSPLGLDDSFFFQNFPLSLNPGDSFTGNLFVLSTGPATPFGSYSGHFELLGGDDGGAFDPISSNVAFTVSVIPTPEPANWALVAGSIALFGALRRKARKA